MPRASYLEPFTTPSDPSPTIRPAARAVRLAASHPADCLMNRGTNGCLLADSASPPLPAAGAMQQPGSSIGTVLWYYSRQRVVLGARRFLSLRRSAQGKTVLYRRARHFSLTVRCCCYSRAACGCAAHMALPCSPDLAEAAWVSRASSNFPHPGRWARRFGLRHGWALAPAHGLGRRLHHPWTSVWNERTQWSGIYFLKYLSTAAASLRSHGYGHTLSHHRP